MRENMGLLQRGMRAWLRDEETEEASAAGCTIAEFITRVNAFLSEG